MVRQEPPSEGSSTSNGYDEGEDQRIGWKAVHGVSGERETVVVVEGEVSWNRVQRTGTREGGGAVPPVALEQASLLERHGQAAQPVTWSTGIVCFFHVDGPRG